MKRIAVFLTEQQIITLRTLAKVRGIKMAEMLRRFLDEGLERERKAQERQRERV